VSLVEPSLHEPQPAEGDEAAHAKRPQTTGGERARGTLDEGDALLASPAERVRAADRRARQQEAQRTVVSAFEPLGDREGVARFARSALLQVGGAQPAAGAGQGTR